MKLPIKNTEDGFILDADGFYICQFWNKREEEFKNADENARNICEAVNQHQSQKDRIRELERALKSVCNTQNKYYGDATNLHLAMIDEVVKINTVVRNAKQEA